MKKSMGFDMVIGLFMVCIFAACVFFALAAGVRVYKDLSAVMEEQYSSRTAMGYLTTKLHQSDREGGVELGLLSDVPAIIIRDTIDGADYTTFVYFYNGYITELFCPATEALLPSDGLAVLPAESLAFSLEGGLLRLDCATKGGDGSAYVALRTYGGAA